ncbi:MAG: GNAT family N-acetyltransferase, partial [Acidimicrobiia bacterium]|nr:GNAT family N-acetyltransferase [Acidimicrobiia bacterium]
MTKMPPRYPSDWASDVALNDGKTVRMRPILPEDRAGLQDLVAAMGERSQYYRFMQVKGELTEKELDHFTLLDYADRMAFVVEQKKELIAVGRYDRDPDEPTVAEVAFSVADDHQGRGIGTRLLAHLTDYARDNGVTAFRAFVLNANHVMMRVFRSAGFVMHRELEAGVYTVDFPTEDTAETLAAEWQQEQRAVSASIAPLFYPLSVAVIGASRDPSSIGGRLFANLVRGNFIGPVFPVNPSAQSIQSVRAYASVTDIPDPVDLAFIVVPSPYVTAIVEECAEKGVKGIVVISAGFSETGEEGAALEAELLDVVRANGIRMVGPNCMGLINSDPAVNLDGQFGPLKPPTGNVAMSSQSGALGIAILDYADRAHIGISSFVSVGNKADISGNDLLLYWEEDPNTDVVLLYLESFGNPRRFGRIARRVAKKKPIVALKSGRTSAGARAASSHTGSLASLDVAVDAVFNQSGVIRTSTLEGLFDITALLANQPVPRGRRVGVLTNAGGPAILAVDALEGEGLDVVELSPDLQEKLRSHLSPEAAVRNPVDMIASAGPAQYEACLDELLASDEMDTVIAIHIPAAPEGVEEVAAAISAAGERAAGSDKTFLSVFMQSGGAPPELRAGQVTVPAYAFPEPAARALAAATRYGEWLAKPESSVPVFVDLETESAQGVIARAMDRLADEGGWLEPDEVESVLEAFGLSLPMASTVTSEDEAIAAAAGFPGSAVLKVISPSALHKSDVGGLVLDVEGDEAVRQAYRQVMGSVPDPEGVLVQE